MVLWVVLEVVMVKDQEVKKKRRCIGFKGFVVKNFSKTLVFVLAIQISKLDDSN